MPEDKLRLHVLLVEDEPQLRVLLKEQLEKAGLIVEAVQNGVVALEYLTKSPVDAVVTDLKMPKMDGLTLRQKAMALSNQPRVWIAFSAYAEESLDQIEAAGFDQIVYKPASLKLLVHQLLSHWQKKTQS
jgi:CheY-like chemotaxis protein